MQPCLTWGLSQTDPRDIVSLKLGTLEWPTYRDQQSVLTIFCPDDKVKETEEATINKTQHEAATTPKFKSRYFTWKFCIFLMEAQTGHEIA